MAFGVTEKWFVKERNTDENRERKNIFEDNDVESSYKLDACIDVYG